MSNTDCEFACFPELFTLIADEKYLRISVDCEGGKLAEQSASMKYSFLNRYNHLLIYSAA